jgi:hypothetical protein
VIVGILVALLLVVFGQVVLTRAVSHHNATLRANGKAIEANSAAIAHLNTCASNHTEALDNLCTAVNHHTDAFNVHADMHRAALERP